MQNNYPNNNKKSDTNACTSRGACSVAPNIAALQEVITSLLKESTHYLLELQKLGADNNNINMNIINDFASLVSINEFSETELYEIIIKEYFQQKNIKDTYHKICQQKKIMAKDIESELAFNEITPLAKIISDGEKIFLNNYKKYSLQQKNLIEIMLILVKSICLHLEKLNDFGHFDNESYNQMLKSIDLLNIKKINDEQIKEKTDNLAKFDTKLQILISKHLIKEFGEITEVDVSHSTKGGKAILVSGNNFFDLKNILEETKDKNIDIYTHSNLLITHALRKFKEYKHLKGHYGDTTESCILDFATFPGAILLTKKTMNNSDYLYRGRLFSTDYTVPKGVIKIDNNNYNELIESAINSKGFKKGKNKPSTKLGYNLEETRKKLTTIYNNLKNGKITHLYIIGMDSYSEIQKEYYKQLFSSMKKDEYAISFFYESNNKNVLTLNIGNYLPLATNLVKTFFDKYELSKNNITFFCTTCNVMTISNIISLKNNGIKSIFMSDCSPRLINPSVLETLLKEYNIKLTTDPKMDLENIRKSRDVQ